MSMHACLYMCVTACMRVFVRVCACVGAGLLICTADQMYSTVHAMLFSQQFV